MPQTVFASLGRGVGLGWGSRGCVGVGPAVALVMTQRPQFVSRSQLSRRGVMAIGNWARAWSIQTGSAAANGKRRLKGTCLWPICRAGLIDTPFKEQIGRCSN